MKIKSIFSRKPFKCKNNHHDFICTHPIKVHRGFLNFLANQICRSRISQIGVRQASPFDPQMK